MQTSIITYPSFSINGICATQTVTGAAGVILNGGLAPVGNLVPSASTSANAPMNQAVTLAGIARTITVTSTASATNCAFVIVGLDVRGVAQTASFLGASGGSSTASDATATSGVDFHVITGVVATASAGPFTVGTGATGESVWIKTDTFQNPFAMSIAVNPATSCPITVQDTPDDANAAAPTHIFNHATLVSVVAAQESNYAFPVRFTRFICVPTAVAGATAVSQVAFQQAGW